MPELNLTNPSLIDILSRTAPDGSIAQIIEIAEKTNPIIGHAVYTECNDGTKHQYTMRTGIPEPAFRRFNQGVQASKSETVSVKDTTAMIEDYAVVDKALADMSGNAAAFRASEIVGKVQGFNEFVARNMIYGNTDTTPEGFMGLAPRLNDRTVASGRQIISAGGSGGTLTSIYAVTWGGRGATLLYPKGSAVGFSHRDLGEDTDKDTNGRMMQVYRDHMRWDIGMALQDWRSCGRLANINVAQLTKNAATGADLLDLLIDLEEVIDTTQSVGVSMTTGELVTGKPVLYVSRTVAKFLRKQALAKINNQLTIEMIAGKRVTMWGNFEVHRLDCISETETAVA